MSDFMSRNAIINQIVADLIAAGNPTYTSLNGLTAENIQYSEQDPSEIMVVKEPIEIWVAPGFGVTGRKASTKFDTDFTVKFLVIVKGWENLTHRQLAVSLSEDIMNYYQSNPDIGTSPRLAIVANPGEMTYNYEAQNVVVGEPQGTPGELYFAYIEMDTFKFTSA